MTLRRRSVILRERTVERSKDLGFGFTGGVAKRLDDRIDLEVSRARAIHDDMVLELVRLYRQAVAAPSNEIDRWRAEQRELFRIDDALEIRDATIEQNHDIDGVARRGFQSRRKPRNRHKLVALREGEIFVEQPVALEGPSLVGKERLRVVEPLRCHRIRRLKHAPFHGAFRPAGEHATGLCK